MSRSGYSDDCSGRDLDLWRGAVAAAIRGKRGQAFLREMLAALDALPEPRLAADALQDEDGEVCAIGSVGLKRGITMNGLDPEDTDAIAKTFGIAGALVKEIAFENDDDGYWRQDTPEDRFRRMRAWVVSQLLETQPSGRSVKAE